MIALFFIAEKLKYEAKFTLTKTYYFTVKTSIVFIFFLFVNVEEIGHALKTAYHKVSTSRTLT